jgi:hypothetical protein
MMKLANKTLVTVLLAGSLPLFAGAAIAAPLSQGKALTNADLNTVEQVQYRRWRNGRWIGPAAGVAAGVVAGAAIGSALSSGYYDNAYGAYAAAPGYDAYAAAPGYSYSAAPGYIAPTYSWRGPRDAFPSPQYGPCSGDRDNDSSFAYCR